MKVDFFSRVYFVFGLTVFLIGQVLLRNGNEWVRSQTPIDYAHWCLLIGALFLLPLVFKLPRNPLNMLGAALMVIGVSANTAMCVIDFIFWSLPEGEMPNEWAAHLVNTSVIWDPFMRIGPNYIFGAALVFPALAFWENSKTGVA